MPTLPQSVYDQFADPSVATITMPAGTFEIVKPLILSRSGVTVHWKGCVLTSDLDPVKWANSFYPVQVKSVSRTDKVFSAPTDPGKRYISRLSGFVTEQETQLTMDEITDVQPGEQVIIHAGVDRYDPVEAMTHLVATVASVSGNVITFAEPLGFTVPDYGDAAGLKVKVDPSLQWKIGDWGHWPSGANYSKGYGRHHGLERFVGGKLAANVVFNDGPTFKLPNMFTAPASALPNSGKEVSVIAAQNVTLNGVSVDNPCGSGVFVWRSFNVDVNEAMFTGQGISKDWNVNISNGTCFDLWGGANLQFSNIRVVGKGLALFSTQAGSQYIELDGCDYNVDYNNPNASGGGIIFGFYAVGSMPLLKDCKIILKNSAPSKYPDLFSFAPCRMTGTFELGGPFPRWFDFAYLHPGVWDTDTVTVNGVSFGPKQTRTKVFQIPSGPTSVPIGPLHGMFLAARLRVKTAGGLRAVTDTFGNNYWGGTAAKGPGWKPFKLDKWGVMRFPEGQTVPEYERKAILCWFAGAAPAAVEIEQTWLPRK